MWLENAFENYHVPTIHRKHIDPTKPQNWQFEKTDGAWEAMYSQRSIVAYSGLPALPNLSAKEAGGLYHIWVKPSLQIVLTSSSMKYRQYLPEGPEKLRLIENWTFPKTTIERPEFSETVGPLITTSIRRSLRRPRGSPHRAAWHALGRIHAGPLFARGIHRPSHRELHPRSRRHCAGAPRDSCRRKPSVTLTHPVDRVKESQHAKARREDHRVFPNPVRLSFTSRTRAA